MPPWQPRHFVEAMGHPRGTGSDSIQPGSADPEHPYDTRSGVGLPKKESVKSSIETS